MDSNMHYVRPRPAGVGLLEAGTHAQEQRRMPGHARPPTKRQLLLLLAASTDAAAHSPTRPLQASPPKHNAHRRPPSTRPFIVWHPYKSFPSHPLHSLNNRPRNRGAPPAQAGLRTKALPTVKLTCALRYPRIQKSR